MGTLLEEMIGREADRRCLFLHGGTSRKELAGLTVSTGEKWVSELSDRELKELFSMNMEATAG